MQSYSRNDKIFFCQELIDLLQATFFSFYSNIKILLNAQIANPMQEKIDRQPCYGVSGLEMMSRKSLERDQAGWEEVQLELYNYGVMSFG